MARPITRIYLTANLIIYLFFACTFFPEGLAVGFLAVLYSIVFSLPALIVLWMCFNVIGRRKPNIFFSWILLLLSVAIGAFMAMLFSTVAVDNTFSNVLSNLSFAAAFCGTLLQGFYIQRYFKSLHTDTTQL